MTEKRRLSIVNVIARIATMPGDSYSLDDSFNENNEFFLKKSRPEIVSLEKELEPSDSPLTMASVDLVKKTKEEEIEEKSKEKKRPDIDDTEVIRKEIVEAKKMVKDQFNYREVSPRLLKAMATLFQEHALLGKTPGIRSDQDPTLLMIPTVENDGLRDIVVMRSPIVSSLERYQIKADSELFKTLKEYYTLHHS